MSNLRTRAENELMGGSDFDDLDCHYPKLPPKETAVEPPTVAEAEPGDPSFPGPEDFPPTPRCISLASIASNAVHAAYERGYEHGFSAGRLAGLDQALGAVNKGYTPPKAKHTDDGNPF